MMLPSAYLASPNLTLSPKDDPTWYVSYLPRSDDYEGHATTALVVGQMQRFYILNGDFRDAYKALIPQGFKACYAFYQEHADKHSRRSDKLEPVESLEKVMRDYAEFLDRTRANNFRVRKCKDGGYWLQERATPSRNNGLAWLNRSKHPQLIDVLSVLKTSRKLSDRSVALIEEEFRNQG